MCVILTYIVNAFKQKYTVLYTVVNSALCYHVEYIRYTYITTLSYRNLKMVDEQYTPTVAETVALYSFFAHQTTCTDVNAGSNIIRFFDTKIKYIDLKVLTETQIFNELAADSLLKNNYSYDM